MHQRYSLWVQQHLRSAGPLTPGRASLPGVADGFAAVRGLYRSLHNGRITLPALVQPLHQVAPPWRQQAPAARALASPDGSAGKSPAHHGTTDPAQRSHGHDPGYALARVLLVDGATGDPGGPWELRLQTARAVYRPRTPAPRPGAVVIDAVVPALRAAAAVGVGERVVHGIDRGADALAHDRPWQAAGHHFRVRADGQRTVRWGAAERPRNARADRRRRRGPLRRCRALSSRGRSAVPPVAAVLGPLDRPAWRHRRRGGRAVHERSPGAPLALRRVVSRVCDERGRTVAVWYLPTTVPAAVPAETIALGYDWRWRVESLFKVLKGAGQPLEHWQQRTGAAIAKRLLVAAMACGVVWTRERAPGPDAAPFRALLVRLSGRQMKPGPGHTAPALLAGRGVSLALVETLEHQSAEDLRAMKSLLRFEPADTG